MPADGGEEAADQIEEGGLAGAVRADDRAQFALGRRSSDMSRTATRLPNRLVTILDFEHAHAVLRCRSSPRMPARKEQNDEHEQEPDERHPIDRDARQIILQDHEHGGAEQRPPEAAHAAHHRHDHEIAGLAVVQAARIGEIVDQRIERAGKRHEEARQRERDPDVPLDGNAEEARAALVLADRNHGAAERRAQDEPHDADRSGKAEQHEIVEIH